MTRGRSGNRQNNSLPNRRNGKVSGQLSSNPTVQEKRAKRQVARQRKAASVKKKAERKTATQKQSSPRQRQTKPTAKAPARSPRLVRLVPSRPPKPVLPQETASRKEIKAEISEADDDIKLAHLSGLVKEKQSGFLHSDEVSVTRKNLTSAPAS